MTKAAELVEQLTNEAAAFLKNALVAQNGFDAEMDDATSCLLVKAATLLASQEAEIERLTKALNGIERAIEGGRTVIAGDEHTISFPDGTVITGEPARILRDTFIAIRDIARAALTPETPEGRQ